MGIIHEAKHAYSIGASGGDISTLQEPLTVVENRDLSPTQDWPKMGQNFKSFYPYLIGIKGLILTFHPTAFACRNL